MKQFNADKELKKLNRKKNVTTYIKYATFTLSILAFVASVIYLTKADFTSNHEFTIIDAKVGEFSSGDITIAYNVEGISKKNLDDDLSHYHYLSNSCTNDVTLTVNDGNWQNASYSGLGANGTKCTLYFAKPTIHYYLDNVEVENTPDNSKYFDVTANNSCDKGASILFDKTNWTYSTSNVNETGTICNLYFSTTEVEYHDRSGASYPELAYGMIPVYYDASGNAIYANSTDNWYDYDDHRWANAVLVSDSARSTYYEGTTLKTLASNTVVPSSSILQYYVWVPRYKYKLFNVNSDGSTTAAEQMIEVAFESKTTSKSSGTTNNTWLTHPAFTFGTTELSGIWVGKFEPSGSDPSCTSESCNANAIKIVPNVSSLGSMTVSKQYYAARGIANYTSNAFGLKSSEVDSHMMKNMEWGAVAYLSASKYGLYNTSGICYREENIYNSINTKCQVWTNPNRSHTTGCAGSLMDAKSETTCNQWNTSSGVNASTTGNMYGIYDMSGGSWEYVMGNVNTGSSTASFKTGYSGFSSSPASKYIDIYANSTDSWSAYENGKLGDATKETLQSMSTAGVGWYGDSVNFPNSSSVWFVRGGICDYGTSVGVFAFNSDIGDATSNDSFRVVLIAQ